jgi:hypothetical protein
VTTEHLVYDRIAGRVTVRDITEHPPTLDLEDSEGIIGESISDDWLNLPSSWPNLRRVFLAYKNSRLEGYVEISYEEFPAEPSEPIGELVRPIDTRLILAADTAILRAIQLFAERASDYFFVLEGADIVGLLWDHSFRKPQAKVCLFALVNDLEIAAISLCSRKARICIDSLSDGRREKALEVFNNRYAPRQRGEKHSIYRTSKDELLIGCTNYIDKSTMIAKNKLLRDWEPKRIERFFFAAEEQRNDCAHPTSPDLPYDLSNCAELAQRVADCRELTMAIVKCASGTMLGGQ